MKEKWIRSFAIIVYQINYVVLPELLYINELTRVGNKSDTYILTFYLLNTGLP